MCDTNLARVHRGHIVDGTWNWHLHDQHWNHSTSGLAKESSDARGDCDSVRLIVQYERPGARAINK